MPLPLFLLEQFDWPPDKGAPEPCVAPWEQQPAVQKVAAVVHNVTVLEVHSSFYVFNTFLQFHLEGKSGFGGFS